MDAIQPLPVLADHLQAGCVGQSGQFGQRILNAPRGPGSFEFDTDQKGSFYRCGFVRDSTPPCLRLLRFARTPGSFWARHLAADLPDRHFDDPPAKVALRRIVFRMFLLMLL